MAEKSKHRLTSVSGWSAGVWGAVFVLTALTAGLLFHLFFYSAYSAERDKLEGRAAQLRQDLAQRQALLASNLALAELREPVAKAYDYIQQYLPRENEMPRLVQMVTDLADRAGLGDGVTLFAPKLPAVARADYAEIPFTLNLQGEFKNALRFLYDLSRMDRIVNITEVRLSSPKMIDEAGEIFHISMECGGSTYRSLTEEEIAARDRAALESLQ